jgi:hypothetical protein
MAENDEPRNPVYLLLLIAGLVFIATVLAYAVVPMLEQKAMDAGTMPPPSPFRDALREDGWKWVLAEVALIVVLGIASMGLDRYRRWKKESTQPTPAPNSTAIQILSSQPSSTAIQDLPPAGEGRK